MRGKIILFAILIMMFAIIGGLYTYTIKTVVVGESSTPNIENSQKIKWDATILVMKNGEQVAISHNTMTNIGLNYLRGLVGQGGTLGAANVMKLGNTTSPIGSTQFLAGNQTNCGLENATGAYTAYSQNGNWSVSNVWTYSCSEARVVNTTGIYNSTTAGGAPMFVAGGNFTSVTLNNNDQLNVTYIISVSSAT